MTKTTILFTLIVGVAALRVATCAGQSAAGIPDDQPIEYREDNAGKRRVETPEVVLQLKYDRGELNKIYLAQFRKERDSWMPSVPIRTNLCADLCHAGLGGASCGNGCEKMLPVGLQSALLTNGTGADAYGEPRVEVCPTLCENQLGHPLCNCASDVEIIPGVDWGAVCAAFCTSDHYTLGGCPPCDEPPTPSTELTSGRVLDTTDGWVAWCNVQCKLGQGGAACNCNRSPLQ